MLYLISEKLASLDLYKNPIILAGCPRISHWSLLYLKKIKRKNLIGPNADLPQVAGCDGISQEQVVWSKQQYDSSSMMLLTDYQSLGLKYEAKVVIIKQENDSFSLLEFLMGRKQNISSRPINKENQVFQYDTLKIDKKEINLFECTEVS